MGKRKIVEGQEVKKRIKEANKRRARGILLREPPPRRSEQSIIAQIMAFMKAKK